MNSSAQKTRHKYFGVSGRNHKATSAWTCFPDSVADRLYTTYAAQD